MSEGARKITGMSGNDGVDDRWLLPLLMSMLAAGYAWLLLPGDEAGLRLMIRTSGRISLVVFSVAFAAAPVARLIHKPATSWIRRNRRLLGLLFAWSQLLHLAGLFALGVWYPQDFLPYLNWLTLLGGGLAYFFTFAMAATSSDRAQQAMGFIRWRRLHLVGGWWIWVVFLQTMNPILEPWYWSLPLLAAALLRLQAAMARRRLST